MLFKYTKHIQSFGLGVRYAHLVPITKQLIPGLPQKNTKLLNNQISLSGSGSKHLSPNINTSGSNNDVDLNISHKSINIGKNKYLIDISLNAQFSQDICKPTMFVCAIDLSSSMNGSCADKSLETETSKFSRLDLVKHSLKTIIHCLRPCDTLALVGFSDNASKLLSVTNMNDMGKITALEIVNNMNSGGMTNLSDGLNVSLDEFDVYAFKKYKNLFTLLLTDGEPNINPPRGIYDTFLERIKTKSLDSAIHTFGYGYNLDSNLLANLSIRGGGLFAHIPDYSMCNTVFINFLANCLATAITKVDLNISGSNCKVGIMGYNSLSNELNLGSIQNSQTQNILYITEIPDPNNFKIKLDMKYDGKDKQYIINCLDTQTQSNISTNISSDQSYDDMIDHIIWSSDNDQIIYQLFKSLLINIISKGLETNDLPKITNDLNTICSGIEKAILKSKSSKDRFRALLINIRSNDASEGQIIKAFSSADWYNRWGKHYLRYFVRSQQLQVCSNFKDSSLQHYGGKLFKELRTEIEDIFSQLPIPTPSLGQGTQFTGNFQQAFYNPSGPCFDGYGKVMMENGTIKLVKDLIKGDKIKNSDGNISTIQCVLKTKIKNGSTDMMIFNGMRVTPWHPVRINNKWSFPSDIKHPTRVHVDYVYDFVLDSHHIITINGIDAITLGHNFTHDPILIHKFFGTDKVIENLKSHKSWDSGLIEITEYNPQYDKDGIIIKFF